MKYAPFMLSHWREALKLFQMARMPVPQEEGPVSVRGPRGQVPHLTKKGPGRSKRSKRR